jgi:hypothetical protein
MNHEETKELRDILFNALRVQKCIPPMVALERANNLAAGLPGVYNIVPLKSERQYAKVDEFAADVLRQLHDRAGIADRALFGSLYRALALGVLLGVRAIESGYQPEELRAAFRRMEEGK